MLYFAYGSNMDEVTLRRRCPSAQVLTPAKLPDHELGFTRTSTKRRCGVADALSSPGKNLWGVLYHIDDCDVSALDSAEGVNVQAYRREQIVVDAFQDTRKIKAWIYIVCTKESPHPKPSREYLDLIVSGAANHGLPADYLNSLRKIQTAI